MVTEIVERGNWLAAHKGTGILITAGEKRAPYTLKGPIHPELNCAV